MGNTQRAILSSSIKTLEQGAFQDFCLEFLPLFNMQYIGIKRFGTTSDGKTRKGTPDLIKTYLNTEQIGVQCSIQETYWHKPKDEEKLEKWKPFEDIKKCSEKMSNIIEIVLCASQEMPVTSPNVEIEIVKYGNSLKIKNVIILDLSRIEEELIQHYDKYLRLIEKWFHVYYEMYYGSPRQARLTLDLYKEIPAPIEKIESSLLSLFPANLDKDQIKEILFSQLESRFMRSELPKYFFSRNVGLEYLDGKILGRIICVFGVPKIGKSSWISQIVSTVQNKSIQTIWFDAPEFEDQKNQFVQDVTRSLIFKLTSNAQIANEFAENRISSTEIEKKLGNDVYVQLVIDNAEVLSLENLSKLAGLFATLVSMIKNAHLGIVLISNKSLSLTDIEIDKEYLSPEWTAEEFEQLLRCDQSIKINENIKKYCRILHMVSGQHPRIALALARKAPDSTSLITIKPTLTPALTDEDLTKEIKQLLLNDLFVDPNVEKRVCPDFCVNVIWVTASWRGIYPRTL